MTEAKVSEVLSHSLILVFLNVEEGPPRMPMKAKAAECLIVRGSSASAISARTRIIDPFRSVRREARGSGPAVCMASRRSSCSRVSNGPSSDTQRCCESGQPL
jgi:hypothetical protein